ncbi:hypothetical protein EJB05_54841, partial [Eragrostis curvula]
MASSFTARPRANNAAAAAQLLSSSRVITPTDDEKKPLWRYIKLLEKTGKGQGGNTKSRLTVHVLEQLRDEVAKAQAVVARDAKEHSTSN